MERTAATAAGAAGRPDGSDDAGSGRGSGDEWRRRAGGGRGRRVLRPGIAIARRSLRYPRRFGATVDFPDDRPESSELPAAPPAHRPQSAESSPPAAAPAAATQEEGDEESIDEYMSRLMGRIRSGNAASESPSMQRPTESPPRRGTAARSEEPASRAAPVSAAPSSPMPQQYRREAVTVVPRTAAPETHSGLSALREVANLSAHSAISHHTRRVLLGQMHSKMLVIAVCLGAAGWLLWAWKSVMAWEATYYSALVALLAATYWGLQYALLSGRLIVNQAGFVKLKAAAHARGGRRRREARRRPTGRQSDGQPGAGYGAGRGSHRKPGHRSRRAAANPGRGRRLQAHRGKRRWPARPRANAGQGVTWQSRRGRRDARFDATRGAMVDWHSLASFTHYAGFGINALGLSGAGPLLAIPVDWGDEDHCVPDGALFARNGVPRIRAARSLRAWLPAPSQFSLAHARRPRRPPRPL